MVCSEGELSRIRAAEASSGTFRKLSGTQRSPLVGSADPKRASSGRQPSNTANYDSVLKGIDHLNLDDNKFH